MVANDYRWALVWDVAYAGNSQAVFGVHEHPGDKPREEFWNQGKYVDCHRDVAGHGHEKESRDRDAAR